MELPDGRIITVNRNAVGAVIIGGRIENCGRNAIGGSADYLYVDGLTTRNMGEANINMDYVGHLTVRNADLGKPNRKTRRASKARRK